MWRHGQLKTILILTPLAFAFAVALDLYIPAVPQLVGYFHSTPAQIQLTLSGFMFAFGVGQLIIGPYADQFGRKPVALLSAIAYCLSSILCALSNTIWVLILFRMLEAFSACGMLVTSNAIIRDVYSGNDSARMYSYLNGAIALSPMFAPFIGGYVDVYFGWRACFITLALLGLAASILVVFLLQETQHVKHRQKVGADVLKRYRTILKNTDFLCHTLLASIGVIALFTFFSTSPYVLIQDLGISREHFGWYFGVMGLLFFIGSLIAAKTVVRIGIRQNLVLGILCLFTGSVMLCGWYYAFGLSAAAFIVPMVPISLGASFLFGSGAAGAMEPFANMAGAAAALYGAAEFLIAGIVGGIVLQFPMTSSLPLGYTVLGASIVGSLILLLSRPQQVSSSNSSV